MATQNKNDLSDIQLVMASSLIEDWEASEEGYSLSKWPKWAKDSFFKTHKNHDDRYKLFVFLWKNGVPPDNIESWVLYHEKFGRPFWYDQNAHRQIRDLVLSVNYRQGKQFQTIWRTPVLDIERGFIHPRIGVDKYNGKDRYEATFNLNHEMNLYL